jgi:hypothetical protein
MMAANDELENWWKEAIEVYLLSHGSTDLEVMELLIQNS